MTKKDIQRGDLVLLRGGRVCVVLKDIDDPDKGLALYGKINSPISFLDFSPKIVLGKVIHLNDYNDDLTDSVDRPFSDYDIMAIRKTNDCCVKFTVPFIFDVLFYNEGSNRIYWDLQREDVKEVTMVEVEEKFGCKVKIVKEESDG
jgi:hypothetical protein